MKNIFLILFVFLLLINGCKTIESSIVRQTNWAKKIQLDGLYNLYKIDNDLYRAEQPDMVNMSTLENYGIKTIINLRHIKNDNHESKNTKLDLIHVRINTWTISYDEIVKSLKAINKAKKPVLIHCLHGSDRTGCIVAAYRMANNEWTKDDAINEFLNGGFGYHQGWFPNILKLLKSINIEQLKKDIKE
jgi:protein tyrosine/serine phosphatase